MTVTDVRTDLDALTLSITSTFPAPVDRVWQLWADPRLLERWWGPPTYPATVRDHDLAVGGLVTYYMTSPEGERYHGWWRILAVEPPRSLAFEDGFADAQGSPDLSMPVTTAQVTIAADPDGGTRMEIRSTFPTRAAMDQLVAMGMVEGMTAALGQIGALLGDG